MRVVISDEAIDDLTNIWFFVGQPSESSADRLIEELAEHCERVGLFPNRYPIVEGSGGLAVRRFGGPRYERGRSSFA